MAYWGKRSCPRRRLDDECERQVIGLIEEEIARLKEFVARRKSRREGTAACQSLSRKSLSNSAANRSPTASASVPESSTPLLTK